MRTTVFYAGRFQPFHPGHHAVYRAIVNEFGKDNVYVSTSAKTEKKSPFPFEEKSRLIVAGGVPADKIVYAPRPYYAHREMGINELEERVVYVVGKEPQRLDALPYPLLGDKTGPGVYTWYVPTFKFGQGSTSATEIRTRWPKLNTSMKRRLVVDYYGSCDPDVMKILESRLGNGLHQADHPLGS